MGFLSKSQYSIPSLILALLILFSPAAATGGGTSSLSTSGDHLRALFVQRIVKYISWPQGTGPQNGEPVIIAATDAASLRPYFDQNATSARFKLVQWPTDTCHLLILTGAPERSIAAILKQISGKPILTIGQNPLNPRMGVAVNFVPANGKLKLQINPKAAGQVGIGISSRLLNLAQIYTEKGSE